MNDDTRVRVGALAVLAAIGLTLAGAVPASGIDGDLTDDRVAEVSITGTDVVVASDGRNVTLLENASESSDVTVVETAGEITITAHRDGPFTRQERARAIEVARRNETVASYLETVDAAELSVEPVERLSAGGMRTAQVEFNVSGGNGTVAPGDTVRVVNVTVGESGDSVTITREPSYVADRAVVVVGPADRKRATYWVEVDLANGTVTDLTDWKGV